jgi:sterol 3beta-glucosyltransferase
MRIAVLTWGTRGDVQPYLALCHQLRLLGHRVVLAANENHLPWLGPTGLDLVGVPLDVQAVFSSDEAHAWLASGKTSAFLRWLSAAEHRLRHPLNEALVAACQGAELIVTTHLLAHRAVFIAEKNDVAAVRVTTFPTAITGDYPTPFLYNGMPRLPWRGLRRLSHQVIQAVAGHSRRADLLEMRRELGLPGQARSLEDDLDARGVRTLNVFSPLVLPRPDDWPVSQLVTGYCHLPPALRSALGEGELPAELQTWLGQGPPPIFFGFGSMPVQDPPYTLAMVGEVVRRLRTRALIGAGWSRFGRLDDPHVRVIESSNHDVLFARCQAVVHHGGAGTTGTGLRAGLPTVVASVFADQPLWGDRVRRLGVGVTLPFQRLTAPGLTEALAAALDPEVVAAARELGQRLRAEDGLGATTAAVLAGGPARTATARISG